MKAGQAKKTSSKTGSGVEVLAGKKKASKMLEDETKKLEEKM